MEVIYCVEIELQIKKLDGIFFLLSSNGCVSVDVKASYISSYYIHPYMTDFYQAKIYALTISSLCSYLLKICIFRKRYVSVAGGGSEITLHGSLDYTQAEHNVCKVTDTIFGCIIYRQAKPTFLYPAMIFCQKALKHINPTISEFRETGLFNIKFQANQESR